METVKLDEVVHEESGMRKFSTTKDGVFVYQVQAGWGWIPTILKNQKDVKQAWFGEKSIQIEYSEFINGEFVGQETYHYNNLDTEFNFELN